MKYTPEQDAELNRLIEENLSSSNYDIARMANIPGTTIEGVRQRIAMLRRGPKISEESRLEHQNRLLTSENRRLRGQLLDEDHFIERTRDVIASIDPPERFPIIKPIKNEYTPQSLVILFSDAQVGELVELEETQLGEYNIEIFEQRVKIYYDSIMSITNRERLTTPINEAHIFFIGDIVEGERIYRGQGARIQTNLVDQFFRGMSITSRFVSELSANFDTVNISCIAGNHGRVGKKDEAKFYVNWDYMLYRYMADTLSTLDNISWTIPKSWWTIAEVEGFRFYLTHGDDLVRYMGVPWYAMERADGRTTKMLQMIGQEYDHMVIGHHHQAIMWDAGPGERIVNGSFSSANYYAAKKMHLMTHPRQVIFGVHPDRGITFRYFIGL